MIHHHLLWFIIYHTVSVVKFHESFHNNSGFCIPVSFPLEFLLFAGSWGFIRLLQFLLNFYRGVVYHCLCVCQVLVENSCFIIWLQVPCIPVEIICQLSEICFDICMFFTAWKMYLMHKCKTRSCSTIVFHGTLVCQCWSVQRFIAIGYAVRSWIQWSHHFKKDWTSGREWLSLSTESMHAVSVTANMQQRVPSVHGLSSMSCFIVWQVICCALTRGCH